MVYIIAIILLTIVKKLTIYNQIIGTTCLLYTSDAADE